jgi:GNAT superfamily N-acetyltransferase
MVKDIVVFGSLDEIERAALSKRMSQMPTTWAPFMECDPLGGPALFGDGGFLRNRHPDYILVAFDENGEVIGQMYGAPLFSPDGEYPQGGWDDAVTQIRRTAALKLTPNMMTLLEVAVHPGRQRQGIASKLLMAAKRRAGELGFDRLMVPARPFGRADQITGEVYEIAYRPDGLPADPWLRAHVRVGGRIERIMHRSMEITLSATRWAALTGQPLAIDPDNPDRARAVGALTLLHRTEGDDWVYYDPNVLITQPCIEGPAGTRAGAALRRPVRSKTVAG